VSTPLTKLVKNASCFKIAACSISSCANVSKSFFCCSVNFLSFFVALVLVTFGAAVLLLAFLALALAVLVGIVVVKTVLVTGKAVVVGAVPRLLVLLIVVLTGNVDKSVVVGTGVVLTVLVVLAAAKSPLIVLIPIRGVVVGCTLFEIGVTIVIGDSVVDNLLGRIVENRVVKNVGKNVVDGKPVVVRKVVVAG
jgi:hypothetical protein